MHDLPFIGAISFSQNFPSLHWLASTVTLWIALLYEQSNTCSLCFLPVRNQHSISIEPSFYEQSNTFFHFSRPYNQHSIRPFCISWSLDQLSVNSKTVRFLQNFVSTSWKSIIKSQSSDCNGRRKLEGFVSGNNFYHPFTLKWFSIQILVNLEIFKLSCKFS